MTYQAIARKYRPETFSQVVGQEHVTTTLRAALRKGKLSHAYLFAGPRGCGKTTVARLLAKALNCPAAEGGDPCGECDVCRGIARGSFLDVLEIDAASNTGVDNIRELRDMAKLAPSEGANRVFIIDEVHMLSKGAFNALLKILEEPPARVFFFFATTEPNKIPRTILSRCQRFDFRLLSREQLSGRMAEICATEGVDLGPSGLRVLTSLAEGSMRDGLSLLDQAIASCEGTIDEAALTALFGLVRSELYVQLDRAIVAGDAAAALRLVDELAQAGQDLVVFARGLLLHLRNLLVLKVDPGLSHAVDLAPEQIAELQPMLDRFSQQDLLAMLDRAGLHHDRIHRSTQPRILLEAALVELCHWEDRVLLADLVGRLRRLLAAGGGAAGGGGDGTRRNGSGRAAADAAAAAGAVADRKAATGGTTARAGLETASADRGDGPAGAGARRPGANVGGRAAAGTVSGWTGFLDAVMSRHPGLAACLMVGLPDLDLEGGRLTVAFEPDQEFMLKRLEDGRADLEQQVAAFFGRPLRVVLQAVDAGAGPSREQQDAVRQAIAPTERETLARECETDPTLGGLVDLVGGQPLPETERERWQRPAAGTDEPGES